MAKKFNPLTPPFDYYEASTPTAPGGSDTQFQYNNGGAFGGCPRFVYNDGTGVFTFGDGANDTFLNFDHADGDGSLIFSQGDGTYTVNTLGMFQFVDLGVTPSWYGGGYDPMVLIQRTQVDPYAGCVALQAWARCVGDNTDFGEVYGFWGGAGDVGNQAGDIGFAAIGLLCYNAFWATNARSIGTIIGGQFTSEVDTDVTATYISAGDFLAIAAGSPTVSNTYGIRIWDPNGAATNNYGLWIDNIDAGTNDYAIYGQKGVYRFGTAFSCEQVGAGAGTAKIGFFGAANVIKATALTAALTDVTCAAPGTPDYAWAGVSLGAWGFASQDEFRTMASILVNLRARVGGLETKLQTYGLLA